MTYKLSYSVSVLVVTLFLAVIVNIHILSASCFLIVINLALVDKIYYCESPWASGFGAVTFLVKCLCRYMDFTDGWFIFQYITCTQSVLLLTYFVYQEIQEVSHHWTTTLYFLCRLMSVIRNCLTIWAEVTEKGLWGLIVFGGLSCLGYFETLVRWWVEDGEVTVLDKKVLRETRSRPERKVYKVRFNKLEGRPKKWLEEKDVGRFAAQIAKYEKQN